MHYLNMNDEYDQINNANEIHVLNFTRTNQSFTSDEGENLLQIQRKIFSKSYV